MNSLCVVLMLMWLSNGQVTSSAIPINIQAGMSLAIEGGHLDSLKSKNNPTIQLRMALELSNGDQRTLVENIQDNSDAATTTPQPTTTTMRPYYTKQQCRLGFIRLGDQCYYFSKTQETWHDALRSCMNLEADLVHPMRAEENSLITTYLSNNRRDILRWWIGGTDRYEEGQWVWAHDKSPMSYTNWVSSKPINIKNFNCAYYWQVMSYKWYVNVCTNRYPFICQQRDLDNVFRPLFSGHGESTKDINGLSHRRWLSTTFFK